MSIEQQEIERSLQELGLKQGDIVILHGALSSMGQVSNGSDAVIDAFLAVLGPAGTLVVPAFGSLGILPETVKNRPEAVQSIHPAAAVSAIGADAEELCRNHWKAETAHGMETPYMRIAERGGTICLLGVDQDRNTMLHTPEALERMPYLSRTAEKTFDTPEGEVTKSWPFFPGPHRDFIGLDRMFCRKGIMRTGLIGHAVVRLIKAADMIDLCRSALKEDPALYLCENPNCPDCVRQRAAIRRDTFSRASFTVATAASLAGRYTEEIVENCRAAGIDAVELDDLGGQPVTMLPSKKVTAAVAALRKGGCNVIALRLPAISSDLRASFERAVDAELTRVVVPLSERAAEAIKLAHELGLDISFYNAYHDGKAASALLLAATETGLKFGFTFSPAGFARAGDKPFSSSYKKKLRRFVDQLDVEDGLFDGTPQALAQGHAEIREMVSILSAASLSGPMVLGAGNRARGNLVDTAKRFEHLLNTI